MSGRARARRICQAAIGVFIDPKKAAYDLAREEIGLAFDRLFPDKTTPAQRLLASVLKDYQPRELDNDAGDHLTTAATDLFARHGLGSAELVDLWRRETDLWAKDVTALVCRRGLTTRLPGLAESPATWNGKAQVVVDQAIEPRLRGLVETFYARLIASLGSDLQLAIYGRLIFDVAAIKGDVGDIKCDVKAIRSHLEGEPLGKTAPPFMPKPVSDFEGYEDEITAIRGALASGGAAAISAVHGIGGVGKSELALKVAAEMRGHFTDGQILVEMDGTTAQARDATDAMTHVVKALGQNEIKPATLKADYHVRLTGKRLLIVLDNVANAQGLDALVPAPPAALLVTSRGPLHLAGATPIELEHLARPAAKALLASIVPRLEDATVNRLAELCCDLPLALRVAGAYLQPPNRSAERYIQQLEERRLDRLSRAATGMRRPDLDPRAVLGLSYDLIAESDPDLARTFTLLGIFPASFDLAAVAAVLALEPDETEHRLDLLYSHALIQQPSPGRWRLHDLLRELAEFRSNSVDQASATERHAHFFATRIETCENNLLRKYEFKASLSLYDTDRANFNAALAALRSFPDQQELALALHSMAVLEAAGGRGETALRYQAQSVDAFRRLEAAEPGKWRLGIANSLINYAAALRENGRVGETPPLLREALIHFSEDQRNPAAVLRPLIATCHAQLSNAYAENFEPMNALNHAVKGARLRKQTNALEPSPKSIEDFSASYLGVAARLHQLNHSACALRFGEIAAGWYKKLAESWPDSFLGNYAIARRNCSIYLAALNRHGKAFQYSKEAVDCLEQAAKNYPDRFSAELATTLSSHANRVAELGSDRNARLHDEQAIRIMSPLFQQKPRAHSGRLQQIIWSYKNRCQKLSIPPDQALLAPIDAVLQRLDADSP